MSDIKCLNIKIYKCSDGFVTDNAQVAKSHEANIKSNKLICLFCQRELVKDPDGYYTCYTDNCGCWAHGGNGASGSKSLWLTLIRTRKALDVAVDALKSAQQYICSDKKSYQIIQTALEQITALEQKEEK